MKRTRVSKLITGMLTLGLLALVDSVQSNAQDATSQIALLVGVSEWEPSSKVPKTHFTESDMALLNKLLTRGGYTVTLMTREAAGSKYSDLWPSRENILAKLKSLSNLHGVERIIVVCSSHGVMHVKTKKSYFLPADATLNHQQEISDPISECRMIAIEELFDTLDKSPAKNRFLFVDACRMPSLGKDPGFEVPDSNQPPKGKTIAFYSCGAGEIAKEDTEKRKSAYFSYYLMQALKGRPRKSDGEVLTMGDLRDYVVDAVKKNSEGQTPELKFNRSELDFEEVRAAPIVSYIRAGSERTVKASDLPKKIRDWPSDIVRKEGSKCIVENVTFNGVFDGTNLSWAIFRDCRFVNCRLTSGVSITNVQMIDCEFDNSDFTDTRSLGGLEVIGFESNSVSPNQIPWNKKTRPLKILNAHYKFVD